MKHTTYTHFNPLPVATLSISSFTDEDDVSTPWLYSRNIGRGGGDDISIESDESVSTLLASKMADSPPELLLEDVTLKPIELADVLFEDVVETAAVVVVVTEGSGEGGGGVMRGRGIVA